MKSASSFEKNDLVTATRVWANDESLTVFEQGHANYGWADYRDNHLSPEMREMKNTKYVLSDLRVHVAAKTAWATFKYTIAADVVDNGKQRHVDGTGLGTAILEKRASGGRSYTGTVARLVIRRPQPLGPRKTSYGALLAFAFFLGSPMFMLPMFILACSPAFMFACTLALGVRVGVGVG